MNDFFSELIALVEKTIFNNSLSDGDRATTLSLAVIFTDIALIDNEFHDEEFEHIKSRIQEEFKLGLDTTYELLKEAEKIVLANEKVDDYAAFLKQQIDASSREDMVRSIDSLIHSDGRKKSFETKLRKRYEILLGVKVK